MEAVDGCAPLPNNPEPINKDCEVVVWPKPPTVNFGAAAWAPGICVSMEEDMDSPPPPPPPSLRPSGCLSDEPLGSEPNLNGEEDAAVDVLPRLNCREGAVVDGAVTVVVVVDGTPNLIPPRGF